MSPLEGLWATETANGGDCWAIFAYFFVFFPLSWPYLQARHYGTPVSPIMGCPPGHGPGGTTACGSQRRPRAPAPAAAFSGMVMGTCLPPVVPAVPTFFRRFHGVPRACPLRARSAGPPRPRFRSYCGGCLYVRVLNAAVGLHPHAPGIGRGLRDTHAHVGSTGYVG